VIGASSERAEKVMGELYAPYVRQGNPVIFMDEKSAELTKYAANSFLATKISFMNEIARVCELTGANVDLVRKGMGSDQRIGKRFLFPGIGYGGSCFPKDVKALIKSASDQGYDFQILNAVEDVNEAQKVFLMPKVLAHFGGDLKGKKIAMWGLAFKPNTDDIREAPALYLIEELFKAGANIVAFDPEAMENVRMAKGDMLQFADNMYDALENADCLLVATEWSEFRNPNFERMENALNSKVIFDGRNVFTTEKMDELGYTYYSVGRESK